MTNPALAPANLNETPQNHDNRGKFAKGNKAGKGNPRNKAAQRLRNALFIEATDQDRRKIARALIEAAKGGDILAIKEFYDRTEGKAPARVELTAGSAGDGKPAFDFATYEVVFAEVRSRLLGCTGVAPELPSESQLLEEQGV